MKERVLITGGSGLIGSKLTKKLLNSGFEVVHLTRAKNSKHDIKTYEWDWGKNYLDEKCLENTKHIIHLAGAGIAEKPWTTRRKEIIVKSRVLTTRLIHKAIEENNHDITSFVTASGIGFYGAITNEIVHTENYPPYKDFIGNCCEQWERSADLFEKNAKVLKLRLGIVLDENDGALPKISSMIKKGLGSPIGRGNQYMPWVHVDDVVSVFFNAIIQKIPAGTYNVVSSQHVNNEELTHAIAKALNKKIRLPNVPSFVLKFIYGELADILLEGVKVANDKIKSAGFQFKYDKLEEALNEIYN